MPATAVSRPPLFARIGPQGTRVTDLAEQARVTKQTAAFLVAQLQRAGYVRRVPDPADARARLVQIAPRGGRCRGREGSRAEVEAEWTPHLGKQAASQLRRALSRLREITDRYR